MNVINTDYINEQDKYLVDEFMKNKNIKKYILGINRLTKSVKKYVEVDGVIDDFTRVQSSRKKDILNIDDVDKNSIILWVSTGSPLEVKNKLDELGFTHISYLSFFKYSKLPLALPPFICDFKDDFYANRYKYEYVFNLLCDKKSKDIFEQVINFKISFDYGFMEGFTNNHEEQYFDKDLIKHQKNIVFVDGGGYVGDTLPYIIKNFPDFKKIYVIEPSELHINIAKRDFGDIKNIEFIQCGLGEVKESKNTILEEQNNCNHEYKGTTIDTIDNLICEKVDFIKLDIEGDELEAIKGAKNSILKYNPILAICIYHKASHWYEIANEVLSINSQYNIYIRHYMEGIFETVMYFIPK